MQVLLSNVLLDLGDSPGKSLKSGTDVYFLTLVQHVLPKKVFDLGIVKRRHDRRSHREGLSRLLVLLDDILRANLESLRLDVNASLLLLSRLDLLSRLRSDQLTILYARLVVRLQQSNVFVLILLDCRDA